MDHNQQGGQPRRHFHRGRRGPDRRGQERRTPNTPPQEQPHRGGDHVDVEQIMRDIRARIAQRHGIELSNQQIQELAARRLEAILDPRTVKPGLLDQLRKSAGVPVHADVTRPAEPPYTFEADTLFETHRGVLRFIRSLLRPILSLFFNPNPLIHALNTQAKLNADAAARETERERRQAEWNALHYELLQRVVTEASRITLEMQALGQRVESLGAKVDFNERRVRAIEGSGHQPQQQRAPRNIDRVVEPSPSTAPPPTITDAAPTGVPAAAAAAAPAEGASSGSEAPRRRRRRRRGRRSGPGVGESIAATATGATDATEIDAGDADEASEAEDDAGEIGSEEMTAEADRQAAAEPAVTPEPASTTPEPASQRAPDEPTEG